MKSNRLLLIGLMFFMFSNIIQNCRLNYMSSRISNLAEVNNVQIQQINLLQRMCEHNHDELDSLSAWNDESDSVLIEEINCIKTKLDTLHQNDTFFRRKIDNLFGNDTMFCKSLNRLDTNNKFSWQRQKQTARRVKRK